jgi:hypothetical protein
VDLSSRQRMEMATTLVLIGTVLKQGGTKTDDKSNVSGEKLGLGSLL